MLAQGAGNEKKIELKIKAWEDRENIKADNKSVLSLISILIFIFLFNFDFICDDLLNEFGSRC